MSNDYSLYAFWEFVTRQDAGKKIFPLFAFSWSSNQLVEFSRKELQEHPAFETTEPDAWFVRIADFQNGKQEITNKQCRKDPLAVFATAAYLSTQFQRALVVAIVNESTGKKSQLYYEPSDLSAEPLGVKQSALTCYHMMFDSVGISKKTDDKITVKIGVIPLDNPSP